MKKLLGLLLSAIFLLSVAPYSVQAGQIPVVDETSFTLGTERIATSGISSIKGYVASIERGEFSDDLISVQSGYINGRYTNTLNTVFQGNLAELYDKLDCDGFLLSITTIQNGSSRYKVYSNNVLYESGVCLKGAKTFEIPVLNKSPGKWRIDFCNAAGVTQSSVSGMVMKL